jgi:hypothetical protein
MIWRSDNGTAQRSYSINSGGYKTADSKVEGPDTPTFPGKYSVDNLRNNRGGLMRSDGYGFSFDVNPNSKQAKGKVQTEIRIHGDGGEEGTHGCIGVCEPARALRDFVQRTKNYLKDHKHIEMRVNDRTGSLSSGGTTKTSNQDASRPSASQVDALNQATGVPSLGAEAVNFAPGRP